MASSITFHERFGEVTVAQLRAYKKFNVSQSDHDMLTDYVDESDHEQIVEEVTNPDNHTGSSFSILKFIENWNRTNW